LVTDLTSNYTSPAGKECTIAAGRFAGVLPSSKVLDIGCGYGDGAINMALEYRCKVKAIDLSLENIEICQKNAEDSGVSHLIQFITADAHTHPFYDEKYDLVLAEGGIFSFLGRKKGLELAYDLLQSRSWLAFSDLIFLNESVPDEVRAIFDDATFHYESEDSYRKLISDAGFDIHYVGLVPQTGWDNYYAHMARRLEDQKGFFSDKNVKLAFHKEIDVFYRLEGFRYVGYLFAILRKNK